MIVRIHGQYANNKKQNKVQLLGSGSMVNEIIAAAELLKNDWGIDASIWSVTSYSELHKEAEDVRRWNILHPNLPNYIALKQFLKERRATKIELRATFINY